ncbi:hypothetical protein M422DRAFT_265377 [Sphaerobolus stellatus SS14]|uniref:Histone-lysine N-methyltransferase, H3 lysine-79 specific n=1 Tax=Sphaerobolus stellatus (strain SS14) TaxID=990650 RepID=A0A0C9UDF0_SPHS4|nr:hypothetical protein M422DRAFT_265377 [Sphaerobolus stellatus SS14]
MSPTLCERSSKVGTVSESHPEYGKLLSTTTYQRSVGPNVPLLRKYQASSSEAYGELETEFVSDIIHYMGLSPSSRFFDMGSGVGTVVLQAALQAGCSASGGGGGGHSEEFHKRCRMWGVEPGKAELLTGDFTDDVRVHERIVDADVVLCNNWAFSEKPMVPTMGEVKYPDRSLTNFPDVRL